MRKKLKPIEIQVIDGYDSFQTAPEAPLYLVRTIRKKRKSMLRVNYHKKYSLKS